MSFFTTYYVLSRFYNRGRVTAEIILESEYKGQQNEDTEHYSQYVDTFGTFEEAEAFVKEAKHC